MYIRIFILYVGKAYFKADVCVLICFQDRIRKDSEVRLMIVGTCIENTEIVRIVIVDVHADIDALSVVLSIYWKKIRLCTSS